MGQTGMCAFYYPPMPQKIVFSVLAGLFVSHLCAPFIDQHVFSLIKHLFCDNPSTTEIFNLNFQSLEVVSRYRDPQLQVTEKVCYL